MAKRKGFINFLALERGLVGLLAMAILVGMGEKLAERFLPVYVLVLGGGPIVVGLLNALDNFLSAIYSWVGGAVADRLGERRALGLFTLLAMIGFLIVILIPAWPAVIVGSVFFLSWTAISLPATMSLIAKRLPESKRTMGVTMHSMIRRVPMGLGPIVGGLFIGAWGVTLGVRYAFAGALVMAAVSIWLQGRLLGSDGKAGAGAEAKEDPVGTRELWRRFDRPLRHLLVADILVRFCEQIPYAFVVVWAMQRMAHPVTAVQFGVLTAIEMFTAMLIYVPVAALADRGTKRPWVVATFVNFTLFPIVLAFSGSFACLVVAFIVRGLKEFGEPTRKALILDLAPKGHAASAFGLYYLIRDVIVAAAAFGGAFLWRVDPRLNFGVAALCGLAGTLWFARRGFAPDRAGTEVPRAVA
jgi:MFS family permease